MTLSDQLKASWAKDGEITVAELWGYFTRFPYMMRLASRRVLDSAIEEATQSVLLPSEKFAVAARKDPGTGRYIDLVIPPEGTGSFDVTDATVVLSVERAQAQRELDQQVIDHPGPSPEPPEPVVPTPPRTVTSFRGSRGGHGGNQREPPGGL